MSRSQPDVQPVVTQAMIEEGLHELGLRSGDIVVAHSALRSFGWVVGGEDSVIDALLACITPSGTLCMPTLTYGTYSPSHLPPPFDVARTPGIVGRISERFRQRPGVGRSLHPTHSMAAYGSLSKELLRDHDHSPTPCGPDSPWGRIAQAGGYVLMIGVGMFYCTMCHGPEEQVEPDARCANPLPCRLISHVGERTVRLRLHRPYYGAVSDRAALEPLLRECGMIKQVRVGNSTLLLINARGLWDLCLQLLQARPARRIDCLREKLRSDYRQLRSSLRFYVRR